MIRILSIFGTRPEAIKLAPVVRAFAADPDVVHATCVTGQHRQMLDAVLEVFGLKPEYDLDIMRPGQDLIHITTAVLDGLSKVIAEFRPDWIIVQGDTSTAMAGALAAFYSRVKVAHVEAGLRTGNIFSPWPEEMNRRLVGQLATLHFPPTEIAGDNLRREHVAEGDLLVTGNTVIDALQWVAARIDDKGTIGSRFADQFAFLDPTKRMILVTGHRRENFDGGLERVCRALAEIGQRADVEIVYPVHLNPNVQKTAREVLGENASVHLIEPQDYLPFVYLMRRAYMIVTDSGGIQEEAPGLGKPVLVTRDTTERPEAIMAGTARLIGTSSEALIANVTELLDDPDAYAAMAKARNPFGDGKASGRILDRIKQDSRNMGAAK
jgi:UDP-N-acetylglucosamine 2-epimerase (non-hydrolysing)